MSPLDIYSDLLKNILKLRVLIIIFLLYLQ